MAAPEPNTQPSAAPPRAAVAIVSYETRSLLDACLASLRADAEAGRAEVWVVDNGSTDGSPEMVAERHPWARLDVPGENLGYGPAVNRVAWATSAPWIVASNADIEVTPGALGALLDAGERDPAAGAVGPRLILPDGSTQASVQPFPGLRQALGGAVAIGRGARARRVAWDPGRAAVVPWVTGAFVLLRGEALAAVGGFDESVWMYGEDLDLCWRLARAGWTTRYEPAAVVHHHESAASREAFGDGLPERWMFASWQWMARRRGVGRTWATAGVCAADAAGRLAVTSALAPRSGRWDERRRRARADLRHAALGLRSRGALLRPERS